MYKILKTRTRVSKLNASCALQTSNINTKQRSLSISFWSEQRSECVASLKSLHGGCLPRMMHGNDSHSSLTLALSQFTINTGRIWGVNKRETNLKKCCQTLLSIMYGVSSKTRLISCHHFFLQMIYGNFAIMRAPDTMTWRFHSFRIGTNVTLV